MLTPPQWKKNLLPSKTTSSPPLAVYSWNGMYTARRSKYAICDANGDDVAFSKHLDRPLRSSAKRRIKIPARPSSESLPSFVSVLTRRRGHKTKMMTMISMISRTPPPGRWRTTKSSQTALTRTLNMYRLPRDRDDALDCIERPSRDKPCPHFCTALHGVKEGMTVVSQSSAA